MKSDRLFPMIFMATVVFISFVLVYYFQLKQNFHIDELYSYGLANSYFKPFPFDKNQWLSGDYYQNYLSPTLETRFQYDSVYYNQVQDVHPPLYYWLLHSVSSFFPGLFSKWFGLSLNLSIHLMTFGLLFSFSNRLIKNRWLALVGAAFWALSVGALSSAMFIRMYHLVGLLQIALLSLSVHVLMSKKGQWRSLLGLTLLCFLGGFTHYYFYLYAFALVLTICLLLLFQGRLADAFLYGLSALVGVLAAFVSFPAIFTHLQSSNRGLEVMENVDQFVLSDKQPFWVFVKQELFLNTRLSHLLLIAVFFGGLILWSVIKTKQLLPLQLVIASLLPVACYIVTVQDLSHYQTARYIYSVYPALIAGVVLLIYFGLKGLIQKYAVLTVFFSLLAVSAIGWSLLTNSPDYLYTEHQTLSALVDDEETQNILVLGDEYWKVSQVVAEIKDFKAIYPSIITNSLTNLPASIDGDEFYVLMLPHPRNQYERVIQDIAKKYQHRVLSSVEIESDKILYHLVKDDA